MKYFSNHERIEIEEILLEYISKNGEIPVLWEQCGLLNVMDKFEKNGIKPVYFKDPIIKKIVKIAFKMNEMGLPVNVLTFKEFLSRLKGYNENDKNVIYHKMLTNRISKICNPRLFDYHVTLFKEHVIMDFWNHIFSLDREKKWPTADVLSNSESIVNGYNQLWDDLTRNIMQQSSENLKDELQKRVLNRKNGIATSILTGLRKFDKFSGGLENSELTLVAARPSMGKTTFIIALAKKIVRMKRRVLIITLEMTRKQLLNRFVAADLDIPYKRIKRGDLTQEEMFAVMERYDYYDKDEYLFIDQCDGSELNKVHDTIKNVNPEVCFIDYLQLIVLDNAEKKKAGNREQEVGLVSKSLKQYAKEFDIPIVALSQLSRAVELRNNKRPMLSDLRESGSLEQDADNIMFLYRDAYYKKRNNPGLDISMNMQGNLELIVAKGREMGLGDFELWLDLIKSEVEEGFRY